VSADVQKATGRDLGPASSVCAHSYREWAMKRDLPRDLGVGVHEGCTRLSGSVAASCIAEGIWDEFAGMFATGGDSTQLLHLDRTQEVGGSSPPSSTKEVPA
jgi:hypothetical protein